MCFILKKKAVDFKTFLIYALITLCISGTLGIALKLTTLTNIKNIYLYPVCYLDWLFISLSIITVSGLFLRERKLRLKEEWLLNEE